MFWTKDNAVGLMEAPAPARAPASPLAVRCSAVVKEFGTDDAKVMALRGADCNVEYGELTLLVGPSGCGKTTLISIMAGLLDPTSGSVEVLGESLNTLKGTRLVNFRGKNIGFVFQQYNLLPTLTAAENAAVPLLIQRWNRHKAVKKAAEMLELVGLHGKANAKPSQLSGGQQQRVAIARALVHEPRLLVCDEPTAALDAHSGQTVLELIRKVAVQPDRAVIVVTHDHRIYKFGDRMILMSDGHVDRVTTPDKFDA